MMSHKRQWILLGLGLAATVALCVLPGCGNGEEQVAVAPPPPAPPPPPPAPRITPVEQLMAELNIDPRVSMSEDVAPDDDEARRAVLEFFDALARGNAQAFRSMLRLTDQIELDALVRSGDWQSAVSKIQHIEIQTGNNAMGQSCALAVIELGTGPVTSFQPQLWYYAPDDDGMLFEAAPTPPGILDKLSGDWIASWHQILAEEMLLAQKPDVEIDLSEDEATSAPAARSGGRSGGGGTLALPPSGPRRPAPGGGGGDEVPR